MKTPALSVILPVYNAAEHLKQTIDSVVQQSFGDFELIIINDGSSDASWDIICSYTDERIVKVNNANKGLAATLNEGIALAKANIIARQDNDDISYPSRFKLQLDFLNAHPDVALLGTAARIVNADGSPSGRFHRHQTESKSLGFLLLFDNPIVHSSVVFRKDAVLAVGGYDTQPKYFEDHRLWSQLARRFKVANLPDVLLDYREVTTGMSKSDTAYSGKVIAQACENIALLLPRYSTSEIRNFVTQSRGEGPFSVLRDDYRTFFGLLEVLAERYCVQADCGLEDIKPAVEQIRRQFLRAYYNTVIKDKKSSFVKRTMARIKRRLLIMMFGV